MVFVLRPDVSFYDALGHAQQKVEVSGNGGELDVDASLSSAAFPVPLASVSRSLHVVFGDVLLVEFAVLLPASSVVGAAATATDGYVVGVDPTSQPLRSGLDCLNGCRVFTLCWAGGDCQVDDVVVTIHSGLGWVSCRLPVADCWLLVFQV